MNKNHKGGGMASRGVSRPMSKQSGENNNDNNGKEDGGMNRDMMLKMHHKQTLWVYWLIIILGLWLAISPLTFSYSKDIVQPSGGRELWLSDVYRVLIMQYSDVICGILLMILGWRSLTPNRPVTIWLACFIGIWLNIAPLVFWAPTSMIYLNDTIVGVLIIALTILIPGMPNMISYMKMGSSVPPGWTYNPSSWPQRWIMIALGFMGWVVSRYLGAFQLGFIDEVWDPFFGESSMKVLNSDMSHSLPVSDGALGALAYTFEFLMGWMGSPTRWRTMPWMVTFFGILVIPLGLVHIFLVISQPVIVGEWCTFCLLAAAIMLPMIPLEFDEVIAMGQHMVQAKRRGDNMWHVFWKGGEPFEKNEDERTTAIMQLPNKPLEVFKSSVWGMSVPWTLGISTALGIVALFAPAIFNISIETNAAHIFHLSGALTVVVSVICMGEIVRAGRFLNILLGLTLAIGPWLVNDSNLSLSITGVVLGALIIFLSLPRGIVKEKYGLWDKYVR
ncbi:MAG: vitamin K epoxide reductase [Cytophagaceae bacterium]|nr:vitamin K epoxide reductase [Cytophagaceae bacterium]|tara:strand:- start:33058 stop:34566 length:1509 start_codon:yes stop_codon:yes gene_type:complete